MSYDEDELAYRAARGDEDAQRDLAYHFSDQVQHSLNAEHGLSLTNAALMFAALAASNGLASNVALYIRILSQRLGWGRFLPGKEDEMRMLISRLQDAIEGRSPDERIEVAV